MHLTFTKGPLGVVIVKDGKVVGNIKDRRPWGFVLKMQGHRFPSVAGSVSADMGITEVDGLICKTMKEAKANAERLA